MNDNGMLEKKAALIESMKAFGDPEEGNMVLPLDDYFEWAHTGSIGCNLPAEDAPQQIYRVLKEIERRDDVDEIWVGIVETMEDDPEEWFYSSRVYVIGSMTKDDLWKAWGLSPDWKDATNWKDAANPVQRNDAGPDDIWEGWVDGKAPPNLPHPVDESKVLMMDWD